MNRKRQLSFFPITFSLLLWSLLFLSFITGHYFWLLLILIHIDLFFTKFIPKHLHLIKLYTHTKYKALQWAWAIIVAIIIYRLVGIFFIEFYSIPSVSMETQLHKGDVVLVNKLYTGSRQKPDNIFRYKRNGAFSKINRNDIIVFNFPEGDTILTNKKEESYYTQIRKFGYQRIKNNEKNWGTPTYQNISSRSPFIKRVIALPGDTLKIAGGQIFINRDSIKEINTFVRKYKLQTKNNLNKYTSSFVNQYKEQKNTIAEVSDLTIKNKQELLDILSLSTVEKNLPDINTFPFEESYLWNYDNLGPLVTPQKGKTIKLSLDNLPIYKRIITHFEGHKLNIINGKIFIDNSEKNTYIFKQNYYWVQGDNSPNSYDSRFWGFVPENHIIGVATHVILSIDYNKPFYNRIRSNRYFQKLYQ